MATISDMRYPMRLQRFLARAGIASRRGSERLMTEGRVCVNGKVVSELGAKVDPLSDEVTVDGVPVEPLGEHTCILLNKPRGYLTTMSDPYGRPCVASLVPTDEIPGLFPVGRLDVDTTGLLLFTTDGLLGQHLLHPSHHVDKTYVALVEGAPNDAALERLRLGVMLDDGPTSQAEACVLGPSDPLVAAVGPQDVPEGRSFLKITIHEGRKHQVKRMCEAIGHPVRALHRHSFGPIALTGEGIGSWRRLTAQELYDLRVSAGLVEGSLA